MTWYPLHRRLGGPQGRSGPVQKISPTAEFYPGTIQHVASRYIDWAIPALYRLKRRIFPLKKISQTITVPLNSEWRVVAAIDSLPWALDGYDGGTRWRSWLRHCATNRKVGGSIPDGVTGIVQWLNPSSRIVALGSTQPVTEMSTTNPSWVVKTAGALGWKPYHLPVPIV
jgi:hypothetical protein